MALTKADTGCFWRKRRRQGCRHRAYMDVFTASSGRNYQYRHAAYALLIPLVSAIAAGIHNCFSFSADKIRPYPCRNLGNFFLRSTDKWNPHPGSHDYSALFTAFTVMQRVHSSRSRMSILGRPGFTGTSRERSPRGHPAIVHRQFGAALPAE